MSRYEVKINSAGARAILSSRGVAADLARRAGAIAAAAESASGHPFRVVSDQHGDRAVAHATYVDGNGTFGMAHEAAHGWLTSAMGAGR